MRHRRSVGERDLFRIVAVPNVLGLSYLIDGGFALERRKGQPAINGDTQGGSPSSVVEQSARVFLSSASAAASGPRRTEVPAATSSAVKHSVMSWAVPAERLKLEDEGPFGLPLAAGRLQTLGDLRLSANISGVHVRHNLQPPSRQSR